MGSNHQRNYRLLEGGITSEGLPSILALLQEVVLKLREAEDEITENLPVDAPTTWILAGMCATAQCTVVAIRNAAKVMSEAAQNSKAKNVQN